MTRAFNIEGLVRLQNYMGGKTLSDARFFAVLNADVVEMPLSSGTTRGRYYRQQETGTSITFINTNPTWFSSVSTKLQQGGVVLFEAQEHDLACYGVRKLDLKSRSIYDY